MSDATPTMARALPVLAGAGSVVRFGFYGAGLFVFVLVAIILVGLFTAWPKTLKAKPAFRITASPWTERPASGAVTTNGWSGRSETRHYGRIHDRERDLTVVLNLPWGSWSAPTDVAVEARSLARFEGARPVIVPRYHDLETRFGPVRAVEMHVTSDGRRKLCLGFLSRFDTQALFLKGWVCEGNGSRPSPNALACAISALALDAPLSSGEADDFLRERLSRPGACSAAPLTQTTDTRRPRGPRGWW